MLLHDLTKELYIHFTLQKGSRSPEKEKKKELKPRKKEKRTQKHKIRERQKEEKIHKRLVYIWYIHMICYVLFL